MAFLQSIDAVDHQGIVINCDECLSRLIVAGRVPVEEKSAETQMGAETVEADVLERLKRYSDKNLNYLQAIRAGYSRGSAGHTDDEGEVEFPTATVDPA